MRILTLTNMYPTGEDPTFGTFVADQVTALRQDPRVESCDVLYINGRSSNRLNYFGGAARLRRALSRRPTDVVHAHGLLEGLNSLIQAAKRRARGYRTNRNFIAMIYLIVGKLNAGPAIA